jgi:D-alanyl-D-alanine carboxypeptidase
VAYTAPARTTTRRVRIRRTGVAALLVAVAATAALSHHWARSSSSSEASSSTAPAPIHALRGERPGPPRETGGATANRRLDAPGETGGAASTGRVGLGEADGAVPDGTSVFDDEVPAVAKLNSDLIGALRRAATDAANDGVQLHVDSGWRSAEYQERLLREAIAKYGSEAQATRWVATPGTSAHVKGDAVDIGPTGAAAWLSNHGAAYGLCRIYANEPWHYELRPEAVAHGCPAMYADPTQDPRMHQ